MNEQSTSKFVLIFGLHEVFSRMFKIDDFYICLDPFWGKSHRKHALIASELYDTIKKLFFIYILCIQFGPKMVFADVRKQQKDTCTSQSNVILNEISFKFKCHSTNFENGYELSLIWISDRVKIMCIFVTVHPSVWESVNAYRVSLAQWLKSTSNDMPEALTRARLPGGTT